MNCKCPIELTMDYDQLLAIVSSGRMCTDTRTSPGKGWMCPTMSKALDKADEGRQRRERAAKKLKQYGYTKEQIAQMPIRTRRRTGNASATKPIFDFDE